MQKIRDIYIKYKKDSFMLLLLFLSFIIISAFLGHIYGSLFMDCGREVYLPELMLKGKVLFKDIFGMYNPLSYQINALLYFLFGHSISVLYTASYINAFATLIGIYLISRIFINEFYSFTISALIMSIYIFGSISVISYIFPYAFAFPYAVTFFIYSVFLFLLYMKTDIKKYICLSVFLLGMSLACKPEFLLCVIPMAVVMYLRKVNIKTFLYSFVLFLLPTILSYGILFIQGLTVDDFVKYIIFIKNFFNTPEQQYYTSTSIAHPWSGKIINYCLTIMFHFFKYLFIGCLIVSLCFRKSAVKYLGFLFIPVFVSYSVYYINASINYHIFCWSVFAIIVVLFFEFEKTKDNRNELLIFLAITGLLSMARINFFPVQKYGYLIYMLLPLVALWCYFIKNDIKFLSRFPYKKYVSLTLLILAFTNIFFIKNYTSDYKSVAALQNKISSKEYYTIVFDRLVNWIEKNTRQSDTILIMPEGVMINFVTKRPTLDKYYHLIPNHIAALGEQNIVNDLKNNKPDYVIITNQPYGMYGASYMCEDFGNMICQFIEKNYILKRRLRSFDNNLNNFDAEIYKLK